MGKWLCTDDIPEPISPDRTSVTSEVVFQDVEKCGDVGLARILLKL